MLQLLLLTLSVLATKKKLECESRLRPLLPLLLLLLLKLSVLATKKKFRQPNQQLLLLLLPSRQSLLTS
jgi:hypothetical protein